ncbi:MAG TPA: FtsX-like permease family protein [Anaerolineae bacterium]|nr:FtsX-like permease family protein [Anaerolineae bacterium]
MLSRLRWNKVIRDFWQHKARSALVVLAIAIGVALIGIILTAREVTIREMMAGFEANNAPHVKLFMGPFGNEVLPIVRALPEVDEVEARFIGSARVYPGPRAAIRDEGWERIELTVLNDYDDSRISVVRPESGTWPPGRNEIILERSSLVLLDVAVGDTITLEMADGAQKELTVAGFAHEFNEMATYISQETRGFISLRTLERQGFGHDYNTLYITTQPHPETGGDTEDPAYREHVRDSVTDRLEKGGYVVYGYDSYYTRPGKHWAYDFFSALVMAMGGVGILALFLSGLLIINTVMALLAQETRQIGMMKAIGAQRSQVVGIYLATILLYGLVALLVAVPLGVVGGQQFAAFGSHVMNFEIAYQILPSILALQAGMALCVPAIAALFPIFAGTRKTVREAISDYGIGKIRESWIDRLLVRARGLPRPLALSLRNTFRRKARLALTLGALSLAGAVFIGVFCTQRSMMGLVDDVLGLYSYDVHVDFAEPVHARRAEVGALQVDGVTRVESWVIASGTQIRDDGTQGVNVYLIGPPSDQQTVVAPLVAGRWLLPEDDNAIVVSQALLREMPGLDVGSRLSIEIDDKTTTWHIVGVILSTDSSTYANAPALARAAGMVGKTNRAVIKIQDADNPVAQQTIARALEERYERAGLPVASSLTIYEVIAGNRNQMNMIATFLLIVAVLLAVVGGLGLGATMGLNVLERTRELGVLRAIGASHGSLRGIIVTEGVLIGLFSWVLGTVLAWPIGNLLTYGVSMAFMGTGVETRFAGFSVWLWLAIAIGVSAFASFWPARRASRMSVREALAYE